MVAIKNVSAYIPGMNTLKRYLLDTGIKQKWLAQQVGVSQVTMNLYVNGKQIPRAEVQLRIQEITKGKVRMGHDWRNGRERRG